MRATFAALTLCAARALRTAPVRHRRVAVLRAQFGGRTGCCVKSENYLDALRPAVAADAPPPAADVDAPPMTAAEMTAGGPPSSTNLWHARWCNLLDASLRKCSGTALLPAPDASPSQCASLASSEALVVVSHGLGDDPVFNYASRAALDLWEADWATFTATPSRLSAEPDERAARASLLERVARDGYAGDYAGVRVSSTGARFAVKDALVWNVYDGGTRVGQAALFRRSDVGPLS